MKSLSSGLTVSSEEIQTLELLGLSLNQARVYFALANLKTATAKTLSNASELATCDVYRTVRGLLKLGLVEILVTSPKEFRATPPEAALSILIERKKEKMKITVERANRLLSKMRSETDSLPFSETKMAIIPCGERASQFGMPMLLNTKKTMDCVQTNALFRKFIENSSNAIKTLLKRNIQIRFVVEDDKAIEKPNEELATLLKNQNLKVRFANAEIKACILLHDDANAFLSSSPETASTPSYWSNNYCFIKVVQNYFETMWREAKAN